MKHGDSVASIRRTARVDLEILARNLTAILQEDDSVVLDARANAFGHGIAAVVRTAVDVGVSTVFVSPHQTALDGVRRSMLMTVPPRRRTIRAEAYGLDGVRPAILTLCGEVIAVKRVGSDAGVSYGYTHRTSEPTTLALVALGYADGVPRLASNRTLVTISGRTAPLVGRVAMDQFVVDCGQTSPEVGDEVVLFGDGGAGHATATDWAIQTHRTAWELTAGLGSRIERVYS